MNKKDELFNEFDIDLETADKIAKEYPSLSDSAKERMFNMAKKKMNTNNDVNETKTNNSSVQGVEKYNRPRWIKFAGVAAAVAIIAGGIAGESYLLGNMKKSAPSKTTISEPGAAVTTEAPATTADPSTSAAVTTTDTATTANDVETTTPVTDVKSSLSENIAHKLTDNYWDYECFFGDYARTVADYDEQKSIKFNYTMQYDGWTSDYELTYCRTIDDRLTEKTMDGLKKLYNTYYSKNYDPFYSPNAEYTNNNALFGPSFTADTLPADGKADRKYTYIEYEGELYQLISFTDFISGNRWSDEQMEITDETETSFTLKRKFNNPGNEMHDDISGEVTFNIVFDEDAQDWRIDQKESVVDYQNNIGGSDDAAAE